jgi:arylsulfatase A-like enzyme/tetratricopeptide (TPR) repeat protein
VSKFTYPPVTRYRLIFLLLTILTAGVVTWFVRSGGLRRPAIRNVVVISIDTCRADGLSCYGFGRKSTPNIDAIAQDAVLFTRAHSTNPYTLPAHSSMLTGTNPPYHGVHDNTNYRLSKANVTLAEILRDHGYRTAAFVSASVLEAKFGLDQGFDTYDDQDFSEDYPFSQRLGGDTSREAITWLDEHGDQPFFLFLHYFDLHAPYEPPEPYASQYVDNPYIGELAYTDRCIGQVIEKLKTMKLYDSTLLMITSDHGESRGDHGEITHGFFIYQSTIHVPFIIKAPGGAEGKTVDDPVGLVDVVPTVLGLLDLSTSHVQGADLSGWIFDRGKSNDRSLYCESLDPTHYGCSPLRALVDGRWKYIWTTRPELYDLVSDPAEFKNVHDAQPEIANQLQAKLRNILTEQSRTDLPGSRQKLDRETMERLRSLGYIGGSAEASAPGEMGPNGEDPKDYINIHTQYIIAVELVNMGRFAEARQVCLEVIQKQPRTLQVISLLGDIAEKEGRYETAVIHYSQYLDGAAQALDSAKSPAAMQRDGDLSYNHQNLGCVLYKLGRFEEAIVHHNKALLLEPDFFDARNSLGSALLKAGRVTEAVTQFTEALRLKPDYAQGHYELARVLQNSGNPENSLAHYDEALRLDPGNAAIHNDVGNALQVVGRIEEAIAHYEDAVRIQPDNARAHGKLGFALQHLMRFEQAAAHYEEALKLEPDDPDLDKVRRQLASLLLARGRFQLAVKHFSDALQRTPDFADPYRQRGLAYQGLGEHELALSDFAKAIEINPADALVYQNRGQTYARLGEHDPAIEDYTKAIELAPGFAAAYHDRAKIYGLLERYEEAVEGFTKVAELAPDSATAYNNLAWVLATCPDEKCRDGKQAVAYANRAREILGAAEYTLMDTLAVAYAEAGLFAEAVRWQTMAVEQAPAAERADLQARLELYKAGKPYRQQASD